MNEINPLVNELCRQAARDGASAIGWRYEPGDDILHTRYISSSLPGANGERLSRLIPLVGDAGRLYEYCADVDGICIFTAAGIADLEPSRLSEDFHTAVTRHGIGQFNLDLALYVRMTERPALSGASIQ